MYENTVEDILKAQSGDKEVFSKLINENTGLIWNIARRFKDRGHELDDLYQIGSIGFIKSIKRFDATFNVKLSTYAVPFILGEIKRFLRDDGPIKVSRNIKELAAKIRQTQKEYLDKTGEDIGIIELSKILNISKEEIAMAIDSSNPLESINKEVNSNDDSILVIDKISSNVDEAGNITDRLAIDQLLKNLSSRDKEIIMLRYYKEKTQTEVAKTLGITQVQVSRLEKKILISMKAKLTS